MSLILVPKVIMDALQDRSEKYNILICADAVYQNCQNYSMLIDTTA